MSKEKKVPDDAHEADRKVRQWALKRNGDPILTKDIVELVLAVDNDAAARHKMSVKLHEENEKRIAATEQLMAACAKQVHQVEHSQEELLKVLPSRLEAATIAAVEASKDLHRNYHDEFVRSWTNKRRDSDAPEEDHREERDPGEQSKQVWLMWMIGTKVGYALVSVLTLLTGAGISYLIFGKP